MLQRRIRGDTGTQQRCRGRRIERLGHAQHESLADHNALGIAAMSRSAVVPVDAIVGADPALLAVLLQALVTGGTLAAGIDQAADADPIARLEARNRITHRQDPADDLVTRHHGIAGNPPVVVGDVQVTVTDAAEIDFDHDIIRSRSATLDRQRGNTGRFRACTVGVGLGHGRSLATNEATLSRIMAKHTLAQHLPGNHDPGRGSGAVL